MSNFLFKYLKLFTRNNNGPNQEGYFRAYINDNLIGASAAGKGITIYQLNESDFTLTQENTYNVEDTPADVAAMVTDIGNIPDK